MSTDFRARRFKANAAAALANPVLQANMKMAKGKFVDKRAIAIKELGDAGDFEGTREAAKAIRDRVIDNLDLWLEKFEESATARGATVLWAKDGAEICRHVVEIGRRHNIKKAAKSKSMLSEEAGLNLALEAAGIQPVETDLGEYILQINNNEPPSHIIAPVIHKSLDEVADLFHAMHKTPRKTEIPALTREAREVLRSHFLTADMGISGGNFLVAETGSVALVTNEGNGRMVTTLPRVHVVITGIEKVIPTLEDLALLMRLLPRSATGQSISNYVSVLTGVKQPDERDGPEHLYFMLVDNGRADVVGSRIPRDAALHPLRRLHEPLPGLSDHRRPRLRLGLSRPDGLGADAALHRAGKRHRPAARGHAVQPVRRGLPGEDSAARIAAQAAREAGRQELAAAVRASCPESLGLGGRLPDAVWLGHLVRRALSQVAGRRQAKHPHPRRGAGMDGGARFPRARGQDFPGNVRRKEKPAMSSREDILGRVRARLNRNAANAAVGRADIEAALSARAQGPRPAVPTEKSALAGRFRREIAGAIEHRRQRGHPGRCAGRHRPLSGRPEPAAAGRRFAQSGRAGLARRRHRQLQRAGRKTPTSSASPAASAPSPRPAR